MGKLCSWWHSPLTMRSFAAALVASALAAVSASKAPEMIHTVLTGKEGELAVEWATEAGSSCASTVQFGPTSSLGQSVTGTATPFESYTVQHTAVLTGLPQNSSLFYKVGGDSCGECNWPNLARHQRYCGHPRRSCNF